MKMAWPKGKPRPPETKQKIALARQGVPLEPKHRAAISAARKAQEAEKKRKREEEEKKKT